MRRRVGALEEAVVVGQLPQLAAAGVGQLGAAVAQVDAPEPGHPVEDLVAVLLPDVHALGPRDDPRAALAELPVIGERVQEMLPVLLLPPGEILSHDTALQERLDQPPGVQTFNSRNSRSQGDITSK